MSPSCKVSNNKLLIRIYKRKKNRVYVQDSLNKIAIIDQYNLTFGGIAFVRRQQNLIKLNELNENYKWKNLQSRNLSLFTPEKRTSTNY